MLNHVPPPPSKKDFRIGAVGSGFIVRDIHLVAYQNAGFNPIAIASVDPESATEVAETRGIQRCYDSIERLLEDPDIEVLDIAVPPHAQGAIIDEALQRHNIRAIHAQKPLAMNYTDALRIVQACDRAGVILAVNQNMRFDH